MAKLTRTWWGTKFMDALNNFMEEGRLKRGRSYSGNNRILAFNMNESSIDAKVRGNANPYFGVYKEPKYKTSLSFKKISEDKWQKIIDKMSGNVALMSKLILNEMPDNIEDVFTEFGENFLPIKSKDINSNCSCPDWDNPCKHIAGVYFRVASLLDRDPFLMFELRGMPKAKLQEALNKTELGKALFTSLIKKDLKIQVSENYYSRPKEIDFDQNVDLINFWNGSKIPEKEISMTNLESVSGILIKKQGDYPPFWQRDNSFTKSMEDIYDFIRVKNKLSL